MKILNLYSGIGGNRKHWEGHAVTSIEIDPNIAKVYKRLYPDDEVIVADCIHWINENQEELIKFDFIWASPPCTTHTRVPTMKYYFNRRIPDLTQVYGLILFFVDRLNHPKFNTREIYWLIENTYSWYKPFIEPTTKMDRHFFWHNFSLEPKKFDISKGKEYRNMTPKQLGEFYGFDHKLVYKYVDGKLKRRQILRNITHPLIGKYILEIVEKVRWKKITDTIKERTIQK